MLRVLLSHAQKLPFINIHAHVRSRIFKKYKDFVNKNGICKKKIQEKSKSKNFLNKN